MARVIVLESTAFVLTEAKAFGELIFVSKSKLHTFNVDSIIQNVVEKLKEINYNPLEDMICLTGPSQKIALFIGTVASMHPEFIVLIFDGKSSKYKQRMFKNDNVKNTG